MAQAYYQSWPSVFIQPDGTIAASLRQHRAGIMVNTVDTRLARSAAGRCAACSTAAASYATRGAATGDRSDVER